MSGTLQSIARLIRDGHVTLAECPARLGITREQLDNCLQLMERQGYLVRQGIPVDTEGCTCGHCCASCCRNGLQNPPVTFSLTAKGERLLRHSTAG
ncbi:hypothetical protein [Methanoregula sp.]|uniref:hypothetical protein n=1 Tax=Methanoregula sp. TaxID=2052170 RepID=UPI002624A6F1|nr:hypothetical protein [Methanoregula sp.]MDD5144207.1 hypothetical protein [Methanoregula sp.]